jgi:hypothetical protein
VKSLRLGEHHDGIRHGGINRLRRMLIEVSGRIELGSRLRCIINHKVKYRRTGVKRLKGRFDFERRERELEVGG